MAGSNLHVDEKVHQSDTRELFSLVLLVLSFFFLVKKYIEKGRERERQRKRKKYRRRVRTALMTKRSFITPTIAIASIAAAAIHLQASCKTI
jgi:hypothetical protein